MLRLKAYAAAYEIDHPLLGVEHAALYTRDLDSEKGNRNWTEIKK
jgi:hypothetical protein